MIECYLNQGKYTVIKNKNILYIGAHPDDVSIGASIAISRMPEKSHILTVSSGVSSNQEWPVEIGGAIMENACGYQEARRNEDKMAMNILGVDVVNNYFNGEIPDQETYLYIDKICNIIDELVQSKGIERIVTHSFPEAHPDHEVVSFCSHLIGQKEKVPVLEYPLYVLDSRGKKVDRKFLDGDKVEEISLDYNIGEIKLREKVLSSYATQGFICKRFGDSNSESFRMVRRDLDNLPIGKGYYYGDKTDAPSPFDINKYLKYAKEIF